MQPLFMLCPTEKHTENIQKITRNKGVDVGWFCRQRSSAAIRPNVSSYGGGGGYQAFFIDFYWVVRTIEQNSSKDFRNLAELLYYKYNFLI